MASRWFKLLVGSLFGVGIMLLGFAVWALYGTAIPYEQFEEDPKFEEQYTTYYQALTVFGAVMIAGGGVLTFISYKV